MNRFECDKCKHLHGRCTCNYRNVPHSPMTAAEARSIIVATFGADEAERIYARSNA